VTPVPAGCPRCGAHTRPGAQWCGLCHTNLTATTVRATAPASARVTVPQGPVDLAEVSVSLQETPGPARLTPAELVSTASAEPAPPAAPAANRGKHARPDPAEQAPPPPPPPAPGRGRRALAVDEDVLGTEAMLALLAVESSKPLHGLAGRLDSNATRVGVMAGGIVLFSALIFVVMAVIGSMI
jgi:uncharacterized membrane protein